MAKQVLDTQHCFSGAAFGYTMLVEADFTAPAGDAYTPPERGSFRRINIDRTIQLQQDAVKVIETFQMQPSRIRLPSNQLGTDENGNDAGNGRGLYVINSGFAALIIEDSRGYVLATLSTDTVVHAQSKNNQQWFLLFFSDINPHNPDFGNSKVAFEDFMFDAYAGNGGNDNQYSFTKVDNNGLSDIDGAVIPNTNDFEGRHYLDSLTSATSRPLVHAFNGINRIKVGAQQEAFEVRVRIETLADITQKFTVRTGLMDGILIGLPTNGIFFSYDPIYPVTPVKQIVTVTPIVTSKEPTQIFTETINSIPYTYTYLTYDVDTLTPNAFPIATYQQISVTWTRVNLFTYTITINGFVSSYTSDSSATDAEITAGLIAAINSNPNINSDVVAAGTKPITITSKILGKAFTYSVGTNLVPTLVTANVPIAQYTVTIGSRPTYTYISDGTPTAAEVVAGLIALINADALCPMAASGTTVLTLTGKVIGIESPVTNSVNLTFAETTASTTAANVVTQLTNLVNADAGCAVVASGTITLILTAKIAGIAFTYSGTANLTQFLTQVNVPEVLYSGNWLANVINNSTASVFNTGIPVIANEWARLKAVILSNSTTILFYINDYYVCSYDAVTPAAAMRYVFKLEKTLGTVSRTASVDYIAWRRNRG